MFRNYPLTCLFIIATICVDLVLLLKADQDGGWFFAHSGPLFYVYNFALPAQCSLLAIWVVMGSGQLLVRAAYVTAAFGALLLLIGMSEGPATGSESVAFNFVQFFTVLCGSALARWGGIGIRTNAEEIRFSLIEMFGWTMIVALWAFALRYALSGMIVDIYLIEWFVGASLSPVLLVPILYCQLSTVARLLWLTSLYLFALSAYVVGSNFMIGPMPLWTFAMALTQITYISAWWAVMRMDEAMQERRAISAAIREKLAVFEPKHGDE